jgi:nucleotide-binding universal stress UspA family protein
MFRRLLVAYDGSEGANRALVAGVALAKALGVDLHAVAVEEELPKYAATLDELTA